MHGRTCCGGGSCGEDLGEVGLVEDGEEGECGEHLRRKGGLLFVRVERFIQGIPAMYMCGVYVCVYVCVCMCMCMCVCVCVRVCVRVSDLGTNANRIVRAYSIPPLPESTNALCHAATCSSIIHSIVFH